MTSRKVCPREPTPEMEYQSWLPLCRAVYHAAPATEQAPGNAWALDDCPHCGGKNRLHNGPPCVMPATEPPPADDADEGLIARLIQDADDPLMTAGAAKDIREAAARLAALRQDIADLQHDLSQAYDGLNSEANARIDAEARCAELERVLRRDGDAYQTLQNVVCNIDSPGSVSMAANAMRQWDRAIDAARGK